MRAFVGADRDRPLDACASACVAAVRQRLLDQHDAGLRRRRRDWRRDCPRPSPHWHRRSASPAGAAARTAAMRARIAARRAELDLEQGAVRRPWRRPAAMAAGAAERNRIGGGERLRGGQAGELMHRPAGALGLEIPERAIERIARSARPASRPARPCGRARRQAAAAWPRSARRRCRRFRHSGHRARIRRGRDAVPSANSATTTTVASVLAPRLIANEPAIGQRSVASVRVKGVQGCSCVALVGTTLDRLACNGQVWLIPVALSHRQIRTHNAVRDGISSTVMRPRVSDEPLLEGTDGRRAGSSSPAAATGSPRTPDLLEAQSTAETRRRGTIKHVDIDMGRGRTARHLRRLAAGAADARLCRARRRHRGRPGSRKTTAALMDEVHGVKPEQAREPPRRQSIADGLAVDRRAASPRSAHSIVGFVNMLGALIVALLRVVVRIRAASASPRWCTSSTMSAGARCRSSC